MSEKSLTQLNTSDEDVTPELDETDEENSEENLNEILQKISECKTSIFHREEKKTVVRFFLLQFVLRRKNVAFDFYVNG